MEFEDLNLENYDHVIMNPPFHKGKKFVHSLVSIFLRTAKKILAKMVPCGWFAKRTITIRRCD